MSDSDSSASPRATEVFDAPTLWVRQILRTPEQGPEDRLELMQGVNLLVGVPNTGKSRWLRMLDYVLGDDKKPEEAFGEDVARKYTGLQARVMVAGNEWTIERQWGDEKHITKLVVNGESMTRDSFTAKLMSALQVPVVHYPQGNPYGARAWPELGWRSIYRHMYRRQLYWADLADRQPESEQHACLLLFTGLAETLFSDKYANLVAAEKRIQQLQDRRDQFMAMLQEVSREVVDEKELGVALTLDSIDHAVQRQTEQVAALQEQRGELLQSLLDSAVLAQPAGPALTKDVVEHLSSQLANLRADSEASSIALRKVQDRVGEMEGHRRLLAEELGRMERAADAGTLLSDLKITHCPACDRAIERSSAGSESCYLCCRPTPSSAASESPLNRVKFEVDQLKAELAETSQLLDVLNRERLQLTTEREQVAERITRLQQQLKPIRKAAASVLPPELAILDQEQGRLEERMSQLRRMRGTLTRRETIADEIEVIRQEVATLEAQLSQEAVNISFETAGDMLTDGMNTYLNAIEALKPKSWTQQPVSVVLRDRSFAIQIGQRSWRSKLGGTLTLFFLMAYHYALMTLAGKKNCHYPGLCVLDFPPQLDGVKVSDSENFVLAPFVELLGSAGRPPMQVIAAGSSFDGLDGAHRVQLTRIWV
jgi:predicted  nucleic acid-binding Zn-ribbon protein